MSDILGQLLEKVAKDPEFRDRLVKDQNALNELGWSPESVKSFRFGASKEEGSEEEDKPGNCGNECGCGSLTGSGGLCTCTNSGGSGAGKPGEN